MITNMYASVPVWRRWLRKDDELHVQLILAYDRIGTSQASVRARSAGPAPPSAVE